MKHLCVSGVESFQLEVAEGFLPKEPDGSGEAEGSPSGADGGGSMLLCQQRDAGGNWVWNHVADTTHSTYGSFTQVYSRRGMVFTIEY